MTISNRARRSSARTGSRLLGLVFATSWLGCGSLQMPELAIPDLYLELNPTSLKMGDAMVLVPQGPGSVFATIDTAAMDALAYRYLATRQGVSTTRQASGGGIFPVEGGFSYDEPVVVGTGLEDRLRYRLRPTDVAHFRHDPVHRSITVGGQSRSLSSEVRSFVERRDPVKRPIYYLTAERFVRVYATGEEGEQTLARVESGTRRGAGALELSLAKASGWSPPMSMASGQPLALQPAPEAMRPH
jgi:hypothetical protein